MRLHETIVRELDRRLTEAHDMPLGQYGVLITLVGAPDSRLRMGELAARQLVSPSGREVDPQDARSFYTVLTDHGLTRLREAQVTHHAVVRELYLGRLTRADRSALAKLIEKAMPGVVSADVWPPGDG